jgi:hypothetical protein
MLSITLMMSPIFVALVLISPIVATTSLIVRPPSVATSLAEATSSLACAACSALFFTASVSAAMECAVRCRLSACCSVRVLKSLLPAAISHEACATVSADCRTSAMVDWSFLRIMLSS